MRWALPVAALLMLAAAPSPATEVVRVGGTGGALGPVRLVGEAFERRPGGVEVLVLPSLGSGGAVKAVADGMVDVGVVSRDLTESERDAGLTILPFGKTALIFTTSHSCTIEEMTEEMLVKLYRDETRSWPCGDRLRLVLRPAGDSDNEVLHGLSPALREALDFALRRPGMFIAVTEQEAADVIEEGGGRLGTTTLSLLRSERRRLKPLSFEGVAPSVDTVADGSYRLIKTFSLVTKKEPGESARSFLRFLLSDEAAAILREAGVVPIWKGGIVP